jgi:hypothetical protein
MSVESPLNSYQRAQSCPQGWTRSGSSVCAAQRAQVRHHTGCRFTTHILLRIMNPPAGFSSIASAKASVRQIASVS